MSRADNGGSAFPVPEHADNWGKFHTAASGMSLRDYFAAKAMAGLMSGTEWEFNPPAPLDTTTITDIALSSYRMADAMVKARSA